MNRVLLAFGYHDQTAPRHVNVGQTLREEGWTIREAHTTRRGFFGKIRDLTRQYRIHQKEIDAVLVTFPGHYLVPIAWLLTRFPPVVSGVEPRKHLIFDAFISLHDTLVDDRGLVARWHPKAWFLFVLDWLSCHLADEVLIDTKAHKKFFVERFGLRPDRIRVIYLGVRSDLFHPEPQRITPQRTTFDILFYGTYIPLQGIEHILHAAAILRSSAPSARIMLIGSGQTRRAMEALAHRLHLTNVAFEDRVAYDELPKRIRSADLCLGIFGTSGKAQRVIPHKVEDAIACGTPIITADSPAIRERYAQHPGVILCKAGDPEDLAAIITTLARRRALQ